MAVPLYQAKAEMPVGRDGPLAELREAEVSSR